MSTLKDILSAFLRDLTESQDTANRATRDLAEEYWEDTRLRDFPVPNALLTEVELDLKYSVGSVTSSGPPRVERWIAAFGELARSAAAAMATAGVRRVDQILDGRGGFAGDKAHWDTVRRNLAGPEFLRYLEEEIAGGLYHERERLLDPDGALRREEACQVASEALDRSLLAHPDLAPAFELGGKAARREARLALREVAQAEIDQRASLMPPGPGLRPDPHAEILLTADELKDIPQQLISAVRIKARLRNFKWVVVEEGKPRLLVEG